MTKNNRSVDEMTQKTHETLAILTVLAENFDSLYSITRPEITKENEEKIFLAYFELKNSIDTIASLNSLAMRQLIELENELEGLARPKKDAVNS